MGNTLIPYNADTPVWNNYESAILHYLGISSDQYRITSGNWSSDWYVGTDGRLTREATFSVESNTARWIATYEEISPPKEESTNYTATATYTDGKYTWKATEIYTPTSVSAAVIVVTSVVGVGLLILFFVLLLATAARKKKTDKQTPPV